MYSSGTPVQELLAIGIRDINNYSMKLDTFINEMYRADHFLCWVTRFVDPDAFLDLFFCALTRQRSMYCKVRS